ncbi:hypothetical protein D9M71_691570 [compost metagenome]
MSVQHISDRGRARVVIVQHMSHRNVKAEVFSVVGHEVSEDIRGKQRRAVRVANGQRLDKKRGRDEFHSDTSSGWWNGCTDEAPIKGLGKCNRFAIRRQLQPKWPVYYLGWCSPCASATGRHHH